MGSLRFHVFGFPVNVQPGFWVLALLLGSASAEPLGRAITIAGLFFASVLAHELGHALVARHSGLRPVITLHVVGGLTSWQLGTPLTRRAALRVTLAGPLAGLVLAGVAVGLQQLLP